MQDAASPQTILTILASVGGIITASAFLYYFARKGAASAGNEALNNYRNLAQSRKEQADELEEEVLRLTEVLKEKEKTIRALDESRNQIVQNNLRLNARLQRYERVINDLQRRAGVPLTDFDDPNFHDTQNPAP